MSIEKSPSGTRGVRQPPRLIARLMMPMMRRIHRLTGDRFNGMDLVYLTTVGARSGQERTATVARFDDGAGGWLVVASAGGAATHPAWYHNIAAHPDQVTAEVSGRRQKVTVEQLEGAEREAAWAVVVRRAPAFGAYVAKTDRQLPVLRLTPTTT
jgi:deazaflavin-dependent oxidoreductase (nitroreductase family)